MYRRMVVTFSERRQVKGMLDVIYDGSTGGFDKPVIDDAKWNMVCFGTFCVNGDTMCELRD